MIEKRNFRKTLKFYQKLLQKEKRHRGSLVAWAGGRAGWGLRADSPPPPGSEVKTMLSKLKGQLEEMRSKVQLLGLVKKYLQARPPTAARPPLPTPAQRSQGPSCQNLGNRSSRCGVLETNPTRKHEISLRVRSLASLRGLRIRRCRELGCRSQTRLGSSAAVAVVEASSCSSDSPPSLGASTGHGSGPRKQSKRREQTWEISSRETPPRLRGQPGARAG